MWDELQNTVSTSKTWSILKALMNPGSTKIMTTQNINYLTSQHKDPTILLATMNLLYIHSACQLRYPEYHGSPKAELNEEFTLAELRIALRIHRGSKSSGPESVSTDLLRNMSDADQHHLLHAINLT
ncbi:hypothetical protein HPB48_015454 [Haemaphysalis longicornis]|uniref:Uncharacterized protein n=1 Tax=Haemaphysalis longicornis TaxID=44386 RepID=A0A9J6GN18_HAELO|nr:hypothetical protein HPB48_015454 [Haemaphysalis longicornis]